MFYSASVAKTAARRLIEKYKVMCPIDLYNLASKIGAEIYETNKLPDTILGSARKSNISIWIITVNTNQILERCRFTIAHEIGHIILNHHPAKYHLLINNNQYKERQANIFATELLMPSKEFKNIYFNCHITDVLGVANYFQVSKQAASIRIEEVCGIVVVGYK